MHLPDSIPTGTRIMVRLFDSHDPVTGRQCYRDLVGHVRSWDGTVLCLTRDASANGSRPAQVVSVEARDIAVLKPVPERPWR
ncbi:DUF6725 family protein [Bifidobacterium cuniculi]|uniref:Uncharacterized protein n=1 Tax=Bifidobacterium cuniculi TaxID=1688 RepID=A0A087B3K5_9BIFI|nr:DUF6725 family protein [Bifidobacterium cuniculi]KFI65605.1 hypothetical protein BCUN_0100 [Bifidobacterium cuniculi]